MLLSYTNVNNIWGQKRRPQVKAKLITTDGLPVIVLEDGNVLERSDWKSYNYKLLKATKAERAALEKIQLI